MGDPLKDLVPLWEWGPIALAEPMGYEAYIAGSAVVVLFHSGPNQETIGYYMPPKPSVLYMIGNRIQDLKKALGGEMPNFIFISPQEAYQLKWEMQAKGEVVSINGVTLVITEPEPEPVAPPPKVYKELNEITLEEVKQGLKDNLGALYESYDAAIKGGLPVTPSWEDTPIMFHAEPHTPQPTHLDEIGPFLTEADWASMAKPKPKVYHTSNKDDWGTPQAFFDTCKKEGPFDLDVCADVQNSKCDVFLSEEMDALSIDWWGKVWMNPPYSQTAKFLTKLIQELQAGRISSAWALVASRTDTQWFHATSCYAAEIRFLKGRLQFEAPGSIPPQPILKSQSAPFPSALLIFNPLITEQGTVFWDWKKGVKTVYSYGKPKPYAKGLASLIEKSQGKKDLMTGFIFGKVPKLPPYHEWKAAKDAEDKAKVEAEAAKLTLLKNDLDAGKEALKATLEGAYNLLPGYHEDDED